MSAQTPSKTSSKSAARGARTKLRIELRQKGTKGSTTVEIRDSGMIYAKRFHAGETQKYKARILGDEGVEQLWFKCDRLRPSALKSTRAALPSGEVQVKVTEWWGESSEQTELWIGEETTNGAFAELMTIARGLFSRASKGKASL